MDKVNSKSNKLFKAYLEKYKVEYKFWRVLIGAIKELIEEIKNTKNVFRKVSLAAFSIGLVVAIIFAVMRFDIGYFITLIIVIVTGIIIYFTKSYSVIENTKESEKYSIIHKLLKDYDLLDKNSLELLIDEAEYYMIDYDPSNNPISSFLKSSFSFVEVCVISFIPILLGIIKINDISFNLNIFLIFIMLSILARIIFWFPDIADIDVGNKKKYKEYVGLLYQIRTNIILDNNTEKKSD